MNRTHLARLFRQHLACRHAWRQRVDAVLPDRGEVSEVMVDKDVRRPPIGCVHHGTHVHCVFHRQRRRPCPGLMGSSGHAREVGCHPPPFVLCSPKVRTPNDYSHPSGYCTFDDVLPISNVSGQKEANPRASKRLGSSEIDLQCPYGAI